MRRWTAVRALAGYVDIWLADYKYADGALAAELSAARDYPAVADAALRQMLLQTGAPVYDADGYLQKGVIVRHLALPGHVADSKAVLRRLAALREETGIEFIPSLMSQFTPFYKAAEHGLGRRITTYEYRRVIDEAVRLGLTDGYMQEKSSAREEYTPPFDLRGCKLTQKPPPLAGRWPEGPEGGRPQAAAPPPPGAEPLASEGALGIVRFFMLFSVFYLSLFLSVGLLLARRAVPDGSTAVIMPLGCGFGVSLLAVLPALFAVVLGFTLPAVALAAAAAAGIGAALLYRGTRLRGMAKDPDSGALWACLLPVVLITLYLLHTHVLHLVDGAYHTGQSCYGDMPMHLGFIKYIAQSGEFFAPLSPAGRHAPVRLSVFVRDGLQRFCGAGGRPAHGVSAADAARVFVGVRHVLAAGAARDRQRRQRRVWRFTCFLWAAGLGFAYFLGSADSFAGIFTGFYTTPTNFVEKNIEWVNPIVDLLIPSGRRCSAGACCCPPSIFCGGSAMRASAASGRGWPRWCCPCRCCTPHSALALVLLCLVGGVYTLAQGPRRKTLLPWLGLAAVCGAAWLCQMLPTVLAQSLDGQHMLRLHFNWINGQDDGTLRTIISGSTSKTSALCIFC